MNSLSNELVELEIGVLICRMTRACREVGEMVAHIESAIIDAFQKRQGFELPHPELQKMDMVIQSMEEMALILERLQGDGHADLAADIGEVVSPIKLEWLRELVEHGTVTDRAKAKPTEVSLF